MTTPLQRRLRWCTLCPLVFIITQLVFILLLMRDGTLDMIISSRLLYRREHVSIGDALDWREFVAHTPPQNSNYYGYNRERSDKMGAIRLLPGTRDDSCYDRTYTMPHSSHAKVSVIISFHNEARSMLLRTIISLVSRTPEDYLHELVLIDDYSEDVSLLDELNTLMGKMYATRGHLTLLFIRNVRRMGLIWSRNKGARIASGHYLLFLDSHCEVNDGWLEPLLDRLAMNDSRAVSPLLDRIDAQTFTYREGNEELRGAFDWSLHFHWVPRVLGDREPLARQYSSPAFTGGIFMISREWFLKLQGFNPHLQIWGGESIEFAIKLWLCGGQIEIVPCSRIGHVFRQDHAFEFPPLDGGQAVDSGQATYLSNSKIIAESWLDEYKYLFYALKPAAKQIPMNHSTKDVELLKSARQCQPFYWYLRHVLPELKQEHAEYSALGTLRQDELCVHVLQAAPLQLLLTSCYRSDISQWYLERASGQLHTLSNRCLNVLKLPSLRQVLTLEACSNVSRTQRWQRRGIQLLHASTHLCLDNAIKDQLEMSICRPGAASQSFHFALEMV